MTAAMQILETVAGVRCPCGHLVDGEHALLRSGRSTVGLPEGMVAVCGPCTECNCRGLLELEVGPDE